MAWANTNNRNGHNGMGRGASEELMDRENQRMTDNLAGKVSRLKNIAFDLETDSKDSNHYLNGMHEDFDGSTGLLSGTMSRVNHMMGGGKSNRKLMCYLILGLVLLFILCYYVIHHFVG